MVMVIEKNDRMGRCEKCQLALVLIGGVAVDMPSDRLVMMVRGLHKMTTDELWELVAVKNRSIYIAVNGDCLDDPEWGSEPG